MLKMSIASPTPSMSAADRPLGRRSNFLMIPLKIKWKDKARWPCPSMLYKQHFLANQASIHKAQQVSKKVQKSFFAKDRLL